MFRFFIFIFLFLMTWDIFAGIRVSVGQKNFQENPSANIDSISYVGVVLDYNVPIIKFGFLIDYKLGTESDEEQIFISDISYGIKKEFFLIIKPFIALGASQNQMLYTDLVDEKITAKYDGYWASVGVKGSFSKLSLELEYREKKSGDIDFDGTSYNLDSNTTAFSMGFRF